MASDRARTWIWPWRCNRSASDNCLRPIRTAALYTCPCTYELAHTHHFEGRLVHFIISHQQWCRQAGTQAATSSSREGASSSGGEQDGRRPHLGPPSGDLPLVGEMEGQRPVARWDPRPASPRPTNRSKSQTWYHAGCFVRARVGAT